MTKLANYFTPELRSQIEQFPGRGWPQRAPSQNGKLLFNFGAKPRLVAGTIMFDRGLRLGDMSMTYRIHEQQSGFVIGDTSDRVTVIETQPFNALYMSDEGSAATVSILDAHDVVRPLQMDARHQAMVIGLLATSVCEKGARVLGINPATR